MKSDAKFKQTIIGWHHIRVAFRRWLRALKDELAWNVLPRREPQPLAASGSKPSSASNNKPLVFVSYAAGDDLRGSHKFCGGEKLLNNLVLLMRRHGYEAWMVSTDGSHADWLAEHAPFLSIEDFRRKLADAPDARCVTSWMKAEAFLRHCPKFYFWDQELAASSRSHFPALARAMRKGRIVETAGVNRVVQTWHMATFGRQAHLLRQLVDENHWCPQEKSRIRNRVGYFDEGVHTASYIYAIRDATRSAGLDLEFFQLRGVEREIIAQMQTCGVFMALNIGKSPWGEGGPMTPQEAMACGTVPVCFDLKGAWELIQQNYNGVILADFTPEAVAKSLVDIYGTPGRLETMSGRCLEITASSHTMEARWDDVRRFLLL